MDSQTLNSFRQQLFTWIEQRLATGLFPFRRVEQSLELFCASGRISPDLVLWINRESCLAGGVILLPTSETEEWQRRGREAAQALGLSNFILWEPHRISLWDANQPGKPTETFELSRSQPIAPRDFEQALDQLLTRLKLLSVAGMMPRAELPPHYFANLCSLTIDRALPGQAETSRMTDDGTRPDTWATRISRQKVWLTLWRLLFLLSRDALPTSLQPHRLEDAMRYALAPANPPDDFLLGTDESPLNEVAAVGFYHLAKRLQQLDWSQDSDRATQTVSLLLETAAPTFKVLQTVLPWETGQTDLTVNSVPRDGLHHGRLVAPTAYQAGHTLQALLADHPDSTPSGASVYDLPVGTTPKAVVAYLVDDLAPVAAERQRHQMKLREVWPNHRFNLPTETPAWLWEGIYLAGMTHPEGELHLILGEEWAMAPGVDVFWTYLLKRYRLMSCAHSDADLTLFHFASHQDNAPLRVIRPEEQLSPPGGFAHAHTPSQLNLCLHADMAVLRLWMDASLQFYPPQEHPIRQKTCEIFLFLHTTLGRHIWQLQTGHALPEEISLLEQELEETHLLLPASDVLSSFSLLDWHPDQPLPDETRLNRVLHSCWGKLPDILAIDAPPRDGKTRQAGRRKIREQVVATVFRDGIPLFPEHYLQHYFRPALHPYAIPGPLQFHDRFFERIYLRAPDGSDIELDNEPTATALLLLSRGDRSVVQLPVDASLTEEILQRYCSDLENLWKALVRECRRHIQARQRALALARTLWKDANLPPLETFQILKPS